VSVELVEFGPDLTDLPSSFPALRSGAEWGCIYAVQFESGLVKVGRTYRPLGRMRAHRYSFADEHGALVAGWLSPGHLNYVGNEVALIEGGFGLAASAWRECLLGVTLDELAKIAGELSYELPDPAEFLEPLSDPLEGLHTVTEAARRIGVDRSTLTRWIRQGQVRRERIGPYRHYIPDAEIERLRTPKGES
jgi:excisionase family DNA binding protein